MITVETFDAYVGMLSNMDWYYDYSDDHEVWCRGRDAMNILTNMAKQETVYALAFNIWNQEKDREKRSAAIAELRSDI